MERKEKLDLVVPIVHLNGTSKDSLLEMREAFYSKLRDAERGLREMAPNGRDYYLVDGLFEKAMVQHKRRMDMLKKLFDEIEYECRYINDCGR